MEPMDLIEQMATTSPAGLTCKCHYTIAAGDKDGKPLNLHEPSVLRQAHILLLLQHIGEQTCCYMLRFSFRRVANNTNWLRFAKPNLSII